MITLITAVPGSGKTLSAIAIILKAIAEKRMVYTNISGLQKELIDPTGVYLHDAPDDWRETPEGSLVIYDECQQPHLYPSDAKRGKVEDERLTAMETHRHTGHDLIFITQAPTFVHHHIRKLVGEHIHLYRARGVSGAMKYTWSHTCDNPNDRAEQQRADSYFWKYDKSLYKYYKSASVHTYKFKVPKKLATLSFFILMAIGYLIYKVFYNDGLSMLAGNEIHSLATQEPNTPATVKPTHNVPATVGGYTPPPTNYLAETTPERIYAFSAVPEAIPVSGCVSYRNKCMCFSEAGYTLELENKVCRDAIKSPLPRVIQQRSGNSRKV